LTTLLKFAFTAKQTVKTDNTNAPGGLFGDRSIIYEKYFCEVKYSMKNGQSYLPKASKQFLLILDNFIPKLSTSLAQRATASQ